jgi:hypothetical protein
VSPRPRQAATKETFPLRLRRRADGTLALTDGAGRITGDDRAFPPLHVFSLGQVIGPEAIARLDGQQVVVELCNARARYNIVDNGETTITAELAEAALSDAPPFDEKAAAKRAAERDERLRTERIAELRRLTGGEG